MGVAKDPLCIAVVQASEVWVDVIDTTGTVSANVEIETVRILDVVCLVRAVEFADVGCDVTGCL